MKPALKILTIFALLYVPAWAAVYYVDDRPTNGNGSLNDPFNDFGSAFSVALPGDTIAVMPGNYNIANSIVTVRDAQAGQRITLKAFDPTDRPLVTHSGRVLDIDNAYHTIDGFVFDGQFGDRDVVRIRSAADHTILRNCEIRNSTTDGVDLSSADDVLIENCEIHHMLAGTFTNQQDAHGIVATGERNLTIRGCNIYYVSGDCFQTDPNRSLPLWDNVLIENCQLWTGPLPADAAGFHAGEVPGENAVDTKINPDSVSVGYRPRITIRNVESYGFEPGYIDNRAAFNIKEQVECIMNRIKVYGNELAFRLRGPGSRGGAHVTLMNVIAYDNHKVFRTEDGIELLHIYNGTFDNEGVNDYFQNVSGGYEQSGFELFNSLFMGNKPSDAADPSNLSANSSFFADLGNRDYHLSSQSPAIDAGIDVAQVVDDFDGNPRTAGSYDVGAFEYDTSTGVLTQGGELPLHFVLEPNYPNPFNPSTNIAFQLDRSADILLEIFDPLGRRVVTLASGFLQAGRHVYRWDGRNSQGQPVSSGNYLYMLRAAGLMEARRMVLLK